MSESPIFSVKDVGFAYGDVNVLKRVSLDVYESDFIVCTGVNGAGKSTFLKLLLNEITPDRGIVLYMNQPVGNVKDWTMVSYAGQEGLTRLSSFPASVFEVVRANLVACESCLRLRKKYTLRRVQNVLKLVGMESFCDRRIGELSGGQMQKVLLARCLISEPKVLILDEPTNGLDQSSREEFYRLLGKLNRLYRLTIILVTHDANYIQHYATRFVRLRDGFCHESGQVNGKV